MRLLVLVAAAALVVPASALGWTWPVAGPVLVAFSFDPAHPYAAGQHRGIDIGAPEGTPVRAPASGRVSFAGSVPSAGKTVTIEAPDGYSVTLLHLGSIGLRRGAAVAEGDPVGTVGPSGAVELPDPYVYLGIRTTSDEQGYLDPLGFLPAPSPPGPIDPGAGPGETVPPVPDQVPAAPPPASEAPFATAEPTPPAKPAVDGRALLPEQDSDPARGAAARASVPGQAPHRPVVGRRRALRSATVRSRAGVPRLSRAAASQPVAGASGVLRSPLKPDLKPAAHPVAAGGDSWATLGAMLGLAMVLCAADLVLRRFLRRRAQGVPRHVRIIDDDALLPDDTDLLRERDAAHRARVYDHCRGRARSAPPPARRGDVLPHRHGRACIEGVPRRGAAGPRRQDLRRPDRRRLARAA